MKNIVFRNVGQNHFKVLPHQGLKTIIELKAHNNPKLKDFPSAEARKLPINCLNLNPSSSFQNFPHIRVVRPSYAYHCCLFLPSTYEPIVQDADFGDLSETVFFPEEFDVSEFGNQSMPITR